MDYLIRFIPAYRIWLIRIVTDVMVPDTVVPTLIQVIMILNVSNHSQWVVDGYRSYRSLNYIFDVYVFAVLFVVGFAGTDIVCW